MLRRIKRSVFICRRRSKHPSVSRSMINWTASRARRILRMQQKEKEQDRDTAAAAAAASASSSGEASASSSTSTSASTPSSSSSSSSTSSPSDTENTPSLPRIPFLQLSIEPTRITPRSCLRVRTLRNPPPPRSSPRLSKHAHFPSDESTGICLQTAARLPFRPRTDALQDAFADRSRVLRTIRHERLQARASSSSSSSSTTTDEDDDQPWGRAPDRDPEEEDLDPRVPAELDLLGCCKQADVYCRVLTRRAIAGGALDFALYVTRAAASLRALEETARAHADCARVGSYEGEERRHAHAGPHAKTTLPESMYADFAGAMSGQRARPAPAVAAPRLPAVVVTSAEGEVREVSGGSSPKSE